MRPSFYNVKAFYSVKSIISCEKLKQTNKQNLTIHCGSRADMTQALLFRHDPCNTWIEKSVTWENRLNVTHPLLQKVQGGVVLEPAVAGQQSGWHLPDSGRGSTFSRQPNQWCVCWVVSKVQPRSCIFSSSNNFVRHL